MSKLIAQSAIRGAHSFVDRADAALAKAMEAHGATTPFDLPNTAYYLPVTLGLTGVKVEKLEDAKQALEIARDLLPDHPTEQMYLPYLGPTLDAGVATLLATEVLESLRYVDGPAPVHGIWLGAADDVIMRSKGVEFVDGSAPGFAAVVGKAPDDETAAKLAREMQEKGLYVFMAGRDGDDSFAEQLDRQGVQLGWDTRLVPFGTDVSAHIWSIGFATRAAMAFGGVQPGDYERILKYNKNRVFAFVMAMGEVTDDWYAAAAGCISYGFPTISTSDIPQILPTGVCTYEHVVSNVPVDELVGKAIEVRGLKIKTTKIDIPVAYAPAFEGERVRKEDTFVEMGGGRSPGFEWLRSRESSEVEDGKITVVGPDLDTVEEGTKLPFGIVVDVYGRKMQSDFEPVIERQFHHLFNFAEGLLHMGQRDLNWIRVSKAAQGKGFLLKHIGDILNAKIRDEFSAIVDKVQITIYTEEDKVKELLEQARASYADRDERMAGLKDETVEEFYSCALCQSFAPSHICVITPERLGLCGAYNWLDAKASHQLDPTGANQPIPKGDTIDAEKGQWSGVNEFVKQASNNAVESFNAYSIMENPMTSCGCFMCIVAIMPTCNAVMVVNREFGGMTPSGMKFSTLAGTVGGGMQVPGFMGIGRGYIVSPKFLSAEGGLHRLAWMPSELKEVLRPQLEKRCAELGTPDFLDMIADETVGESEEEILEFMTKVGHPALTMDSLF